MGRVDWPRRILTVLVGIPTALKLLHSDTGMWCLATTLCIFSIVEFSSNIVPKIARQTAADADNYSTTGRLHVAFLVLLSIAVCSAAWTSDKMVHDVVLGFASVAVCCFHLVLVTRVDLPALSGLLLDFLALEYIVGGFSHAILLRYATPYGLGFQILGLSCAWVCDSGALIAGNFFGHKKLAPVVSPGKTVVGAVTGVLSSAITVTVLFHLHGFLGSAAAAGLPWVNPNLLEHFLPPSAVISFGEQVVLGLVLGVLCIVGDLVESLLKRVADVKDSGVFFPGHGGCLDRMDSFLFVAQFLFYYSHFQCAQISEVGTHN